MASARIAGRSGFGVQARRGSGRGMHEHSARQGPRCLFRQRGVRREHDNGASAAVELDPGSVIERRRRQLRDRSDLHQFFGVQDWLLAPRRTPFGGVRIGVTGTLRPSLDLEWVMTWFQPVVTRSVREIDVPHRPEWAVNRDPAPCWHAFDGVMRGGEASERRTQLEEPRCDRSPPLTPGCCERFGTDRPPRARARAVLRGDATRGLATGGLRIRGPCDRDNHNQQHDGKAHQQDRCDDPARPHRRTSGTGEPLQSTQSDHMLEIQACLDRTLPECSSLSEPGLSVFTRSWAETAPSAAGSQGERPFDHQ